MADDPMVQCIAAEPGGAEYVAPRNGIEAAVAEIWSELLEVPQVGAGDNFLLLGGESLMASQAASRIRLRFGCDVSLRAIFVGTVADVAGEIAAATHAS
jgi:hypothetical protein